MTTVYVAAEKLMNWTQDGHISIDENLIRTFVSHCTNNRFVVYFAPVRFGLWFDGRNEVEDAWHYIERALTAAEFHPDDVILFNEEVSEEPFVHDMEKQNLQNSLAVIFSDAPQDEALSLSLGIRKVTEIPANISNMWQKINIRRVLRTFVAAAMHT